MLAQRIEERQHAGARGKQGRGQAGQLNQRGVEDREPAFAVKDRKADVEVGKGAGQGLDKGILRLFAAHQIGDRRRVPEFAAVTADCADFIPVGLPRRCLEPLALEVLPFRQGKKRLVVGNALRCPQLVIGGVAPAGPARWQHLPDRGGHGIAAELLHLSQVFCLRPRAGGGFDNLHPAKPVTPGDLDARRVIPCGRDDAHTAFRTGASRLGKAGKARQEGDAQIFPDMGARQQGKAAECALGCMMQHRVVEKERQWLCR